MSNEMINLICSPREHGSDLISLLKTCAVPLEFGLMQGAPQHDAAQ